MVSKILSTLVLQRHSKTEQMFQEKTTKPCYLRDDRAVPLKASILIELYYGVVRFLCLHVTTQ